jgi:hypothetical protein
MLNTMKIYINNFNINVLSEIMELLSSYLVEEELHNQIYSIDGIYLIDEKNITKLISIDNDIKILKNYHENFTLIVDPSYYVSENANAIEPQHIVIKIRRHIYKLNKQSRIQLVIEGRTLEKPDNMTPNDIYFEMPNDIDINNILVKKELIEFLSLLN